MPPQPPENRGEKEKIAFGRSSLLTVFLDKLDYPARPPVAKAVPKSRIAIFPVIPVNIALPRLRKFVYPPAALTPSDIEIFPKRGGALFEHGSVILLHNINRKALVARGDCL